MSDVSAPIGRHPRPAYERAPVIERVATVWGKVDQEMYESRFEEWRQQVEAEFPFYEPLQEWTLNITEKEGIPLWDTMHPELKITPRFSKKLKKDDFDWSIRCPAGQFTVNMHSSLEQPRRYTELQRSFSEWLPRWISHFGVKEFSLVQLVYINTLNSETLPSFYDAANRLLLDQVLTVFVAIPGKHESLAPPYDCRATLLLGDKKDAKFEIHTFSDVFAKTQPTVRLDMTASVPVPTEQASATGIQPKPPAHR